MKKASKEGRKRKREGKKRQEKGKKKRKNFYSKTYTCNAQFLWDDRKQF